MKHEEVAVVLVAEGFDEQAIEELCALRENGKRALLVALTAGLVASAHGIRFQPDRTLHELLDAFSGRITVLVLGGPAARLALDPRVERLVRRVEENEGAVVALQTAQMQL
jgi:hypothetical protein